MIQIRKIAFEKIEKNRWNGLVHYAPSPSVYAYHWYLKAVAGPFDVLVEENYESGIPVFEEKLDDFQRKLLPETGIYSINLLSSGRIKSFYEVMQREYPQSWFAVKSGQSDIWSELLPGLEKNISYFLTLHQPYEKWMTGYTPEFSALLCKNDEKNIRLISNPKPEELLVDAPLSEVQKNMLYRVMYNAMHRGTLFTSQVMHTGNGQKATGVFIYGQGSIFEIWSHTPEDFSLMAVLYDYLFRTHTGRNMTLRLSPFVKQDFITLLNPESRESLKSSNS